MASLADLVSRWFSAPGDFVASGPLVQEAQAHAVRSLAVRAQAAPANLPLRLVAAWCRRPGNAWLALRLPPVYPRGDPPNGADRPCSRPTAHGDSRWAAGGLDLGNAAAGLLLEEFPTWRGRLVLDADEFGLVSFYRSDWSLWLGSARGGPLEVCGAAAVELEVGRVDCRFHLAGDERPFLILPRVDCWRMLTTHGQPLDAARLRFPHPDLRPRVQQASALAGSQARYEPSCCQRFAEHAGLTGAIAAALVRALAANSPGIAREFADHVSIVRGYELPGVRLGALGMGRLGSFSQPWRRGVIGLNVTYAPEGGPRLSPFCFTWLGHELGHQRHYVIEGLAAARGQRFVEHPERLSPPLARYGRPLCLGTLFQVPYVHLYEWALLMDYLEGGFAEVPWSVPDEALATGDDLAAEIGEALALLGEHAELTELGRLSLAHVRRLTDQLAGRWRRLARRETMRSSHA